MTVLTTSQAIETVGRSSMRRRLDRGVWQRPCRGVVVTHNGPLTFDERVAVALASAPPGSALAGPTALAIDGFTGFDDGQLHIVIPRGGRHPSMANLTVHVSRELSDSDVHPARAPRRTRPARSVVDFASWQASERRTRSIVIASQQQRLTTTRTLREALTRRGPCRHRALIVESILDAAGGIQSLPERDFRAIWERSRLPGLTHQKSVRAPGGRYFLDAYCEALGFAVEVHGVQHQAVQQWDGDLVRANEIAIQGRPCLQFSSFAVRRIPDSVIDQLHRMAMARGWNPPADATSR